MLHHLVLYDIKSRSLELIFFQKYPYCFCIYRENHDYLKNRSSEFMKHTVSQKHQHVKNYTKIY